MRLPAREGSSRRMRRFGVLVFFLLCQSAGSSSLAQESPAPSSGVGGVVRSAEGTPVPGATVRLISTDTSKVWLSWTDESGKFEFPQIAAGRYRVEASQLGFVQTSLVVEVPVVPPGAIPIVLRVATLAELSAAPAPPPSSNKTRPPASKHNGQTAGTNNRSGAAPGSRRGAGGREQLPTGAANALREGLTGGFEETELTGEGTNPQGPGANGVANEGPQAQTTLSATVNSNATSDSFLLQGTVGQSLAPNGPGGFGQNS